MQRWRARFEFWHDSVILNGVCPTIGVIGGAYLIFSGSRSTPAALLCVGFVGLRAVGPLTDLVTAALSRK